MPRIESKPKEQSKKKITKPKQSHGKKDKSNTIPLAQIALCLMSVAIALAVGMVVLSEVSTELSGLNQTGVKESGIFGSTEEVINTSTKILAFIPLIIIVSIGAISIGFIRIVFYN